ncbi:CAAX amino terminal protease self- immunity [compost metagenome]
MALEHGARRPSLWSWALVILAASMLATLLLSELKSSLVSNQASVPRWLEAVTSISTQWLSFFAPAWWLAHRDQLRSSTIFPLRRITVTECLVLCLATIGLDHLTSVIQDIYSGIFHLYVEAPDAFRILDLTHGLMLLVDSSLTPGFVEEWLFRGYLLGIFLMRFSGPVAIVLTAACFTAFHFDLVGVPTYLISGIWFGWLRLQFGSLWPAILAHALGNAMVLVYANSSIPTHPALELGLGIPCFLFGLWWIPQRTLGRQQETDHSHEHGAIESRYERQAT